MRRTAHARLHAEVAIGAFFLLAVATVIIAVVGTLRPVFAGTLAREWTLASAAVFAIAAGTMAARREWGWYIGLAVAVGFSSAGLIQLVVQQPLGIATILVGVAVMVEVLRSSSWFPNAAYPIVPRSSGEPHHVHHRGDLPGPGRGIYPDELASA